MKFYVVDVLLLRLRWICVRAGADSAFYITDGYRTAGTRIAAMVLADAIFHFRATFSGCHAGHITPNGDSAATTTTFCIVNRSIT